MFGLFGSESNDEPSLRDLGDIERLIRSVGSERSGAIIRQAARDGNVLCQVFMSQAGLQIPREERPESVQSETEFFTKLAAESGDPGSQFNLAKMYIDKFPSDAETVSQSDLDLIREAKRWHRKAAQAGFEPSIQALKRLECFPD